MSDQDVFLYFYPIDPPGRLHGFDNKRVKIAIERVKLAVGGAKVLKGLGFDFADQAHASVGACEY